MIRAFDMPPANIAFATLGALLFVSPSLFGIMADPGDTTISVETGLVIGAGAVLLLIAVLGHRIAQVRRDLAVGAVALVLAAAPPCFGFGLAQPLYRLDVAVAVLLLFTSAVDLWKRRAERPHRPAGPHRR